jgi:trk system potassium uptake protein
MLTSLGFSAELHRMHIVVAGCGRVGSGLVGQLEAEGHSVSVIDKRESAFRRIPEGAAAQRIVGLSFDRDALLEAGIERAGAFAAVTSGDNSNILAVRIAKETFQVGHVVARIYDPARASFYARLGIATVATVAWTTDQISRRLLDRRVSDWTDQSGTLSLIEQPIPLGWCGRELKDLSHAERWRVVGVSRAGQGHLVSEHMVGQEGDILHLMVSADGLAELDRRLSSMERSN